MVDSNGTVESLTLEQQLAVLQANYEALNATSLAQRVALMGRYGLQYDGRRDMKEVLGYLENPQFQDFWAYSLRGLGARLVEVFPKDTWGQEFQVRETEEPGVTTDFEEDWQELEELIDIWGYFHDLDLIAQTGEYGALLVGIEGVDNYEVSLEQQASRSRGPKSLQYLRVYRQDRAKIKAWNKDRHSRTYGTPALYDMETRIQGPDGVTFSDHFDVHASHCVHFADNTRDNRILGVPLLLKVIDALFDLNKQMGGIGEMTWRDAKRKFIAEAKDRASMPDKADFEKNVQAFAMDLKDFLVLAGTDTKFAHGTVPNISDNVLRTMQLIAGILDYPMRKLFGSEQGQLATDQDNRTAHMKIVQRIRRVCEPRIFRPFVDKLIGAGVLRPPQDGYELVVPELTIAPEEKAKIDRLYVQNARDLVGAMGEVDTIITPEEQRMHGFSLWRLSPEPEGGFLEEDDDVGGDDGN